MGKVVTRDSWYHSQTTSPWPNLTLKRCPAPIHSAFHPFSSNALNPKAVAPRKTKSTLLMHIPMPHETTTKTTKDNVISHTTVLPYPRLLTDGLRCSCPCIPKLDDRPGTPKTTAESGSPGASSPSAKLDKWPSGSFCAPKPTTLNMLVRPPLVAICSCSCRRAS